MFDMKANKAKRKQRDDHTKYLDRQIQTAKPLEYYSTWLLKQNLNPSEMLVLYLTIAAALGVLPASGQKISSSNLSNITNATTEIYPVNLTHQPAIVLNTLQHTTTPAQKKQYKSKKIFTQMDDNNFILFQAIGQRDIEKLKSLKKLGVNINKSKIISGKTSVHPFMLACSEGNLDVVETLIDMEIDIYCGNSPAKLMPLTALISGFALRKSNHERFTILEKLISHGLNVDPKGANQNKVEMLLFHAEKLGWPELRVFLNNHYNNKKTQPKTDSNTFFDPSILFSFFYQTEVRYKEYEEIPENEENDNKDKEKTESLSL